MHCCNHFLTASLADLFWIFDISVPKLNIPQSLAQIWMLYFFLHNFVGLSVVCAIIQYTIFCSDLGMCVKCERSSDIVSGPKMWREEVEESYQLAFHFTFYLFLSFSDINSLGDELDVFDRTDSTSFLVLRLFSKHKTIHTFNPRAVRWLRFSISNFSLLPTCTE